MQELRNIPHLRFPEFNEEWEVKAVGKLTTRVSNPVDVEAKKNYQQIGIRSHGKGIFHKELVDGKSLGNKRVFWVKENALIVNIVFAWEQAVAKTTSNEVGMIASHRFPMYLPIEKVSDLDYLLHFFLTKKGKALLELASPGGAGRNKTLGQKEFENLKFKIPSYAEQNKIASFLSVVDRKISELNEKKNLLERYKKGVMQKLFSQELRFKDDNGKDFPKWEKKRFFDIFSFRVTNSYSRENLNYESGEIKNIHYGDIHTKFNSHFDITKEHVPYINSEIELKRISEDNYCKEGDLIIADASEDYADVGKCIEIINLNGEKVLAGLHTILARPDKNKMSLGFNGHLMKSENIRLQIMKIAQGSKVLSISATRLSDCILDIPCEKEQTKISNFLSVLDEKISCTENQIRQTEQYKKGLLQNMFV